MQSGGGKQTSLWKMLLKLIYNGNDGFFSIFSMNFTDDMLGIIYANSEKTTYHYIFERLIFLYF